MMSSVAPLHRTLEQELQALLRGASLECLVCGEFVLHAGGMVTCPECNSSLRVELGAEETQLQFDSQAG
jgi:Zn finger protein HypA/HybF involved in hydrogenase expression